MSVKKLSIATALCSGVGILHYLHKHHKTSKANMPSYDYFDALTGFDPPSIPEGMRYLEPVFFDVTDREKLAVPDLTHKLRVQTYCIASNGFRNKFCLRSSVALNRRAGVFTKVKVEFMGDSEDLKNVLKNHIDAESDWAQLSEGATDLYFGEPQAGDFWCMQEFSFSKSRSPEDESCHCKHIIKVEEVSPSHALVIDVVLDCSDFSKETKNILKEVEMAYNLTF